MYKHLTKNIVFFVLKNHDPCADGDWCFGGFYLITNAMNKESQIDRKILRRILTSNAIGNSSNVERTGC